MPVALRGRRGLRRGVHAVDVAGALTLRHDGGDARPARVCERVGCGDANEIDAAIAIRIALGAQAQRSGGDRLRVRRLVAAGGRDVILVAEDVDARGDRSGAVVRRGERETRGQQVVIRRPEHAHGERGVDRRRLRVEDGDRHSSRVRIRRSIERAIRERIAVNYQRGRDQAANYVLH